ncbi:hypothetical protein M0805_005520, partial [Coniferiporia weirii]
ALSGSLQAFNESFASYLHVMEMNALTTDWPQAPTDASYELAKKRAEDDAHAAQAALRAAAEAAMVAERSAAAASEEALEANETAIGNTTGHGGGTRIPGGILKGSALPKKKGKPKMTPKERRERSLAIDKAVSNLPLEFRGQDPNLRRNVESVIELLMDNPNGLEILNFVKPPELNQARANKCLLALIN